MQGLTRRRRLAERTPVRKDTGAVFELVKSSSEKNRNFFIAFVGLLTYVMVAVISTNDLMLFLPEASLKLPLLAVDVPVLLFFAAAPLFVALLHGDLLFNLVAHHKKLMAWKASRGGAPVEEIQPFVFDFSALLPYRAPLAAREDLSKQLVSSMRGLTNFVIFWLAPLTLALTTYWFSAYQSWKFTLFHAALVFGDLWFVAIAYRQLRKSDISRPPLGLLGRLALLLVLLPIAGIALACVLALIALEAESGVQTWHRLLNAGYGTTVIDSASQGRETFPYNPDTEGTDTNTSRHSSYPGGWDYGTYTSAYSWGTTYDYDYVGSPGYLHLSRGIAVQLSTWLPRTLDLRPFPELRRFPQDAVKLRQIETGLSEQLAWREIGREGQSIDLSGRRLRFAKLAGVRLRYANLQDAKLDGADLSGVHLQHAKLHRASLVLAVASDARFDGAMAAGADFSSSTLPRTSWLGAELSRSTFDSANMNAAAILGAFAVGASFKGAELERSNFAGSMLGGAGFDGAQLEEATFARANLTGSSFRSANLYRARFHNAAVTVADFSAAMVQATQWRGVTGGDTVRGWNTAYATQAGMFVRRPPTDTLVTADVARAYDYLGVDLRPLHDKLVCDTAQNKTALAFGPPPSPKAAPVRGAAKCAAGRQPPEGGVLPAHLEDAVAYISALSHTLCADVSDEEEKARVAQRDLRVLQWLVAISAPTALADGNFMHAKPSFPPNAIRAKLKEPACSQLDEKVQRPEQERIRRWLAGNFR